MACSHTGHRARLALLEERSGTRCSAVLQHARSVLAEGLTQISVFLKASSTLNLSWNPYSYGSAFQANHANVEKDMEKIWVSFCNFPFCPSRVGWLHVWGVP